MRAIKFFFLCLVMATMLVPATPVVAQGFQSDIVQADDSQGNTNITDKKKDKDVIEINKVFYWSLLIDIITVILIIFLVYYPTYKKMDNIFTLVIFNLVIFVLTFVLNKVKISMGAAFGLFAVFSMLRYRTAGISMKDMTYLFIFIAIGLLSAIQLEYKELIILNVVIFLGAFVLDGKFIIRRESSKIVRYENIQYLGREHREVLLEDLRKRTGYNVHRISVEKIDFLRDTAFITIYYYE